MGDGRLGIFLADASGHGLAPALVVSQIRTLVRALCDGSTPNCSPHEVIKRVHKRLSADLDVSAICYAVPGIFWASDGTPGLAKRPGTGRFCIGQSAGSQSRHCCPPFRAINSSIALRDHRPAAMNIKPGGMLAVMSDGIFESFDVQNQLLGIDRVIDSLEKSQGKSVVATVGELHAVVERWQTNDQPKDDQTIILVNRMVIGENSSSQVECLAKRLSLKGADLANQSKFINTEARRRKSKRMNHRWTQILTDKLRNGCA